MSSPQTILAYGTRVSKDADVSSFGDGERNKVVVDTYSIQRGKLQIEFELELASVASGERWIYVVETCIHLQIGDQAHFLGNVGQTPLHIRNAYDEALYRYSSHTCPVSGWVVLQKV